MMPKLLIEIDSPQRYHVKWSNGITGWIFSGSSAQYSSIEMIN